MMPSLCCVPCKNSSSAAALPGFGRRRILVIVSPPTLASAPMKSKYLASSEPSLTMLIVRPFDRFASNSSGVARSTLFSLPVPRCLACLSFAVLHYLGQVLVTWHDEASPFGCKELRNPTRGFATRRIFRIVEGQYRSWNAQSIRSRS
jgi:hypothetical protein